MLSGQVESESERNGSDPHHCLIGQVLEDGVEVSTRGTTALVYCLINSSLYTGTVQGWWSTPQLV